MLWYYTCKRILTLAHSNSFANQELLHGKDPQHPLPEVLGKQIELGVPTDSGIVYDYVYEFSVADAKKNIRGKGAWHHWNNVTPKAPLTIKGWFVDGIIG